MKNLMLLILALSYAIHMNMLQRLGFVHTEKVYSIKTKSDMKELDIQKDFGAIPNDNKSDHEAFRAAADFINKWGGNCKLNIPEGTYLVGKQTVRSDKGFYLKGEDVLNLKNVENVIIRGTPNTIIKFNVGLRFGSFDRSTGLSTNKPWPKSGKSITSERADLGTLIYLDNSSNIQIENLLLDGNFYPGTVNNMNNFDVACFKKISPKFLPNKINLGGGYGGTGVQLAHYGIFVYHSGNILINNVISKRFGTDGLQICNFHNVPNQKNVTVNNSTFDYNGRTGVAITGGDQISFNNCTITNTGQCMFSATGTGVDLEAQKDKGEIKLISNVHFKACYFSSNREGEVLARYGLGSSDVVFENCEFISTRRAIYLGSRAKNYTFHNNKIGGNKVIQYDDKKIIIKNENDLKTLLRQTTSIKGNRIVR